MASATWTNEARKDIRHFWAVTLGTVAFGLFAASQAVMINELSARGYF